MSDELTREEVLASITLVMRPELAAALADVLERVAVAPSRLATTLTERRAVLFVIDHVRAVLPDVPPAAEGKP
jgi:hypothetical protein